MKKILKAQIENLKLKFQPQLSSLINRWSQLQTREKSLVLVMLLFVVIGSVFTAIDSLVKYKKRLQVDVSQLNQMVIYVNQASDDFKYISKLQQKSFTTPSAEQVKADVVQITSIENPMVNLQDGQLTISIPEVQFNQVMMIQDQLRRSYGIFPDQLTITKQKKDGYVSFTAMFWVN